MRLDHFDDVKQLIARHCFFDEISTAMQERYLQYIGIDRRTFEAVNQAALINPAHVYLRNIQKPTRAEIQALIAEIATIE